MSDVPAKPASILVVEDNPITRKMMRVALQSEGYAVREADCGRVALELASAAVPDLVIQDLMLPDMEGFELALALKSLKGMDGVPLIACSGFLSKVEEAKSPRTGFADVLYKPVEPSRLVETVRMHLGRPRSLKRPAGTARRLLVVEDDPLQLKLLKLHLARAGFEVEWAGDGKEALEQAQRSPPDAIVSDVLLPGMDGFRLCQAARKDPALAGVPVVLFSAAYVEPADRAIALAAGANDLLFRGPDFTRFCALMAAALESPVPAPQAAPSSFPLDDYTRRVALQLERQVSWNRDLVRRLSLLQSEFGTLANISDLLKTGVSVDEFLKLALDRYLDAAGISCGAFYLLDARGKFVLRAQQGFENPERLENFRGHTALLRQVIESGEPIGVSPEAGSPELQRLAEELRATTLFLAPLRMGKERLGVFVMASSAARFETEWWTFLAAAGNQIGQFLGLFRTLSDQKRLEEQLRQSQKMEAVGRLAGGIAHDFNNILTVISGYSQMLLRRMTPEDPVRPKIEEIHRAGERAAALTRQLLAFSRKQPLSPKPLDLGAVLTGMKGMLERLIGEDIRLVVATAPDSGQALADPGQVEQVVMNLAVNARDAMPKGGTLTLETGAAELDAEYARRYEAVRPGRYVLLAVSDTGSGMADEVKAHLFEPFFTTKAPGKGTGLGLATVYGIMKQSGGHVSAYSEPGKGTTFKVYFPRIEAAGDAVRPPAALPVPRPASGASGTVLLVEDEATVRALAREILEESGYSVLEARDGREAMELCRLRREPIDVLLTDVVMPRLSGPELAEALKPLHPEAKVLFMSGYADAAAVEHGVLAPGTPMIQKPFTPEALTAKIRGLFGA